MNKSSSIFLILTFLIISTTYPAIVVFSAYKNSLPGNLMMSKIEMHAPSTSNKWLPKGNAICIVNGSQISPQIVSDGAGGAIITWQDMRDDSGDIYAQRIDLNGNEKWSTNGTAICTAVGIQDIPQIVSDGVGGAIITWKDRRTDHGDIYAQRVDSNGNILWTPNGITICTAGFMQIDPCICGDGEGGAIISWSDDRTWTYFHIYAQRINSSGQIQWGTNGEAICDDGDWSKFSSRICSDGTGGAIITWQDGRSPYGDIYARRVNSSGNPQWDYMGVAICNEIFRQGDSEICSDGAGGAIIVWVDDRIESDIYAQRIDIDGSTLWANNGTEICIANRDQYFPQICIDGAGGAIITWQDERRIENDYDIYVQKIDSNGNVKWATNGEIICNVNEDQMFPQICSDGAGGAIITWQDMRDDSGDIYVQKIDSNGNVKWVTNGEIICNVDEDQRYPQICSDGAGGAIITWEDERRIEDDYDIFVQRIKSAYPTSTHPDSIRTSTGGSKTIDWELSDDSGGGEYRVISNNSAGYFYVWEDWAPWTNNTSLDVPINRTALGVYNYTVEYYDNHDQLGIPDTVIVTIEAEKAEKAAIPSGNYYLLLFILGITYVIIKEKRRKSK